MLRKSSLSLSLEVVPVFQLPVLNFTTGTGKKSNSYNPSTPRDHECPVIGGLQPIPRDLQALVANHLFSLVNCDLACQQYQNTAECLLSIDKGQNHFYLFPYAITAALKSDSETLSSLAKVFTKRISRVKSNRVTSNDESIKNTKSFPGPGLGFSK